MLQCFQRYKLLEKLKNVEICQFYDLLAKVVKLQSSEIESFWIIYILSFT